MWYNKSIKKSSIKFKMKKIKNKKILVFFAIIFSFVITSSVSYAGTAENGRGWLWGGGTEPDGVSPWNGSNTNFGWVSMNNLTGGGSSVYGVNIPAAGLLTGYAWSENIGWIDFGNKCVTSAPAAGQYQAASCTSPAGGTNGVSRSGNSLTGWARIVSIATASVVGNSGGWSGWIKMINVSIAAPDASNRSYISGYGWSDELGWVKFHDVYFEGPVDATCGSCATTFSDAGRTTWPSCDFCAQGDPVPVPPNPAFPSAGNSVNWVCSGLNGGNPTNPPCTAYYDPCTLPTPCDWAAVCEGQTCTDCNGTHDGTKRCPDLNWQEVKP